MKIDFVYSSNIQNETTEKLNKTCWKYTTNFKNGIGIEKVKEKNPEKTERQTST